MTQDFFNEHSGLITPYFWIGQIVDDTTWKGNELRKKWKDPKDIPGFGSRYKVRIFGRDSSEKDTTDDQLELAEIMYPVTAGSGHAGSFQSANLRKGTYVVGFYKDGVDATEPIIIGCLGNNDQTKLSRTVPLNGFVPFSGYIGEKVPTYSIPPGGSPPVGGPAPKEGGSGSNSQGDNSSDQQQLKDGEKKTPLNSPTRCEAAPINGIRLKIQNLIKDIEAAQKKINSWEAAVAKPINFRGQQLSITEYINIKIADATKDITKFTKDIVEGVRKFVKEKITDKLKKAYNSIFPNGLPSLKIKIANADDLISCLFNKIIKNLFGMIGKFLKAIIDRFINTPLCAVGNFIGGLLGKLTGFISSLINKILAPIEALLGLTFGLGKDILGFVKGLLGFLSCDDKPACAEITEWSLWDGAGDNGAGVPKLDIANIFNKAKDIGSLIGDLIDPDNFNFDLNLKDLLSNSCDVGPTSCSPPKVVFYGGGGSGATANAIISATGDILGVDIITPGFGYSKPPFVTFVDNCGNGNGAVGRAVIVPQTTVGVGTTAGGVSNVIVTDPGEGYLLAPDGSRGGDGRVWANRCQSSIKRVDGTWDSPYDSESVMSIQIGDTVQLAGQAEYISTVQETITAPPCPPEQKIGDRLGTSEGVYPIILSMCEITVTNPGLNYSKNDEVIISPDNGAKASAVLGEFGTVDKIEVSRCGIGYTEKPNIYIETETGYNVELVPVFTVSRIGDLSEQEINNIPSTTQIISVIDCVGKV